MAQGPSRKPVPQKHPFATRSAPRRLNVERVGRQAMDAPGAASLQHSTSDVVLSLHGKIGNRGVAALLSGATHRTICIQRHESPEHNALGTIPPKQLAGLATARDLLTELGTGQGNTAIRNAIHTLEMERRRVRQFQASPPDDITSAYSVPLVKIDNDMTDGTKPVIATYGEMNMLADFFGSMRELRIASNATILKLLQTERQVYYEWLGRFQKELTSWDFEEREIPMPGSMGADATVTVKYYRREGAGEDAPYDVPESNRLIPQQFEGSQKGLKAADALSPMEATLSNLSEYHGADMALARDPGVRAARTGGAWGAVARNACHFAPQSWYAWKENHDKARQLARESADMRTAASRNPPESAEELEALAADLANEALLTNGFGDHYLQDSYSAGHLMNKTLIMQWFLGQVQNWNFVGPGGSELKRLEQMSEEAQPGLATRELYSKDPSLQSMGPQSEADAATGAEGFQRAGLRLPPGLSADARELLLWWRTQAVADGRETITVATAAGELSWEESKTQEAMDSVVEAKLAEANVKIPFMDRRYKINDAWIAGLWAGRELPAQGKSESGEQYDAAATMTLGSYHEFINDTLLSSGAGALHDLFCKQGLTVANDESDSLFKIYGDKALLDAGAAKGLEIAGETSKMSLHGIEALLAGKDDSDVPSIEQILARLPSKIQTPEEFAGAGAPVGVFEIETFHDELRPWLEARLEDGHWLAARLPEDAGGKKLTDPRNISPHVGEEF